jgi:hypothetical protein
MIVCPPEMIWSTSVTKNVTFPWTISYNLPQFTSDPVLDENKEELDENVQPAYKIPLTKISN